MSARLSGLSMLTGAIGPGCVGLTLWHIHLRQGRSSQFGRLILGPGCQTMARRSGPTVSTWPDGLDRIINGSGQTISARPSEPSRYTDRAKPSRPYRLDLIATRVGPNRVEPTVWTEKVHGSTQTISGLPSKPSRYTSRSKPSRADRLDLKGIRVGPNHIGPTVWTE